MTEPEPITTFVVTDIESDGHNPLESSMLSFASVACDVHGTVLDEFEAVLVPRADRKPAPETMEWWQTQPEAWKAATENAEPPEVVMPRYADWVESLPGFRVFAAAPMIFDGPWMDHYLWTFAGTRVLGGPYKSRQIFRGGGVCIYTMAGTLRGAEYLKWGMQRVPPEWYGHIVHSHKAIDDARGFANVLAKLFEMSLALDKIEATEKRLPMKFTLDWLKEHLTTDASAETIADTLTMIGLEVEAVEDQGKLLRPFVTAYVISAEKHPNADKLRVCLVDAGGPEPVKVVCGAPNARTGMKGVFAAPGTYIPGTDFVLQKGVIRGEESNGMLCSGRELQLNDDHSGIIELPDDAPVGVSYVDYAGLGGVVFDIAITPNRGDAAGVYGVARDLAAYGLGTLRPADVPAVPSPGGRSPIEVALRFGDEDPKACRMFAGRLITGLKNGPSPDWLQARLRAIGLRPISTLVDITNYVTYDRARPLHVFDAGKLSGTVHARMARKGESMLALDGKTYELDEGVCVIADDSGPLSIGGIIGGEASGSSEETTSVFIESAWFDPDGIAATGRRLGIVSDARYRFERTVDPESVIPGIELATRMVVEMCGGIVHETAVAGLVESPNLMIDFPVFEVERLTGLRLSQDEIAAILGRLGFAIDSTVGHHLKVRVPSWRPDVTQRADLVEEVMRMVGVDKVPVEPLPRLATVAPRMLTPIQNRRRLTRRALAARGFDEAVTWSFIPTSAAELFGGGAEGLKLANPIASDMTDMRPSLLPGLLAAAARNGNRGRGDVVLAEVGQVFLSDAPDGQHTYATGIRTGTASIAGAGRHWRSPARKADVFDAKADLAAVLDPLGIDIDKVQVVAEPASWCHPGRGGRVQLGPKVIVGWFGEVHPAVLEAFDLDGPVAAFEIDLDAIPEPRRKATRTKPALAVSDLNPVSRDFAFVLDRDVPAGQLLRAARGADKGLIADVSIFDVFEGTGVPEGKKSIALAVTLQPQDHTLTDEEIERVSNAVVAAVAKTTGGTLRT